MDDILSMQTPPADPRGGFKFSQSADICGTPWGGEIELGPEDQHDTDIEGAACYYESHYQTS